MYHQSQSLAVQEHVVITGGTRGIGKALANEFLKRGYRVSLAGRSADTLAITVEELITKTGNNLCYGYICDVTNLEDLNRLWDSSTSLQEVHIWINNAGVGHINHLFHTLDSQAIVDVIDVNIKGTVLASKVALKGMLNQGFGFLYNMEGFGSDGRIMKGMSIYGSSKSAVRYFTKSLIKEYQNSHVKIGTISPGMVVTDMLLEPLRKEPELNKKALKVFHILADSVEEVTPFLVLKIIQNTKHGTHISWLNKSKISRRFLSNMFKKRKVKGLPDF